MTIPSLLLLLAMTLSGEAGPLGPNAEVAVAKTVVARLESASFPDELPAVLEAYYGRGEPTITSLALAHLVLRGELEAGPYYYVFSEQDRRFMGWRSGDETISGHGLMLHLSSEWPGR